MTPDEINRFREKMTDLYRRANDFCARHPEADRNVLIQSWRMRDQTPLQKVEFALLRGKTLKSKNTGKC